MVFGPFSSTELLIILFIILILFGASRLPQLARALGGVNERVQEGSKRRVREGGEKGGAKNTGEKLATTPPAGLPPRSS